MNTSAQPKHFIGIFLAGVCLYALFNYAYFHLRFVGQWNEIDTHRFLTMIDTADQADSVVENDLAYSNGLTYTAISLFLMELTGIPAEVLPSHIYPAITILFPILVFVTYRALTHDSKIAILATLLLYMQSDFLWVSWRGSHEKITWMMVLMSLYFIARSFTRLGLFSHIVRYALLFYLVAFTLVTTNVFFASLFITTLLICFIISGLLLYIRPQPDLIFRRHIFRLGYMTLVCSVLMYLMIFYIYPPAQKVTETLNTLTDQVAAFLLSMDGPEETVDTIETLTNPGVWWLDASIYIGLTLFNWITLGTSLIVWLVGIFRTMRSRQFSSSNLSHMFLWLAYAGFVFQFGVSTIVDMTGAALGANWKVRLFTPMMLIAIPLAAFGISAVMKRYRRNRLVISVVALLMLIFVIAAPIKVTNEPLLNNAWIFTTKSERDAGAWATDNLAGSTVWVGINERLEITLNQLDNPMQTVHFDAWVPAPETQYYLISDLERIRWLRSQSPAPNLTGENIVYHNGSTSIFHRRPRTPFQK